MPSSAVVPTTVDVWASTRVSVPASGFVTHTESPSAATCEMPGARLTAPSDGVLLPPTRQRVPSVGDEIQAASAPTAMSATGEAGISTRAIVSAVRSSSSAAAPSTPSAHTPARPAATAPARTARETAVIAPVEASIRATP